MEEIDPHLFAECLGIKVVRKPLPGFDGLLMRIGDNGVIISNSEVTNLGRVRFTIAHELGHWFLHPTQSQDFLLSEESVAMHKASPMESEANAFAGSLLMPRRWFGSYVSDAEPLVANMLAAADAFQVSVMAATKRFLDLTPIPSVAVFSDGEVVKWVWKSQGVDKVWLRPGDEIAPMCTAYACDDTPEVASRVGAIESSGEDWFPNDFRKERIIIKEQSCRLYREIVLTFMRFDIQ